MSNKLKRVSTTFILVQLEMRAEDEQTRESKKKVFNVELSSRKIICVCVWIGCGILCLPKKKLTQF